VNKQINKLVNKEMNEWGMKLRKRSMISAEDDLCTIYVMPSKLLKT